MKPSRIFLVRHGESEGNINHSIYMTKPDYSVELTPRGRREAVECGIKLREVIKDEKVQFYVSPFFRTRQTYLGIIQNFTDRNHKMYEDPRLREQEWGQCRNLKNGFRDQAETERDAYGHFYYRFSDGESCADVFDRVSDFMNTLFRDFQKEDYPNNVVIVSHGMAIRVFLMRWFHKSIEEFESWGNPKNCEIQYLQRDENGKYLLITNLKKHIIRHPYQFGWEKFKELSYE